MARTFDCPKCGAPVAYVQHPVAGAAPNVRCDYCHSTIIPPDELHGQSARIVPIKIHLGFSSSGGTKWIWLLVAIPVFIGLIVVLAMAGILAPVFYSISRAAKETPRTANTKAEEPPNSFAAVLMKFGREGIGPGMFRDARSIALDGAGRIYVGEYTGGRVQVFDPSGKFINQWSAGDRKTIIRGFAADRKGIVYVAQGGKINRYQGETGQLAGEVEYEDRPSFDDVAVTADGGLVAASRQKRDDIVRFDSSGKVVKTIPEAISGISGDSELAMRVAVDGIGNIYALGRFNNAVFKFSPEGKFVNRFGGSGDAPGQLRAAYSIAVDGKGRVYVGDSHGIQVFDENGRYLAVFHSPGAAMGMVFNDQNELFVVGRESVIKFAIKGDQPAK